MGLKIDSERIFYNGCVMTLYNPARFAVNDLKASFDLIDRSPFATVISVYQGESQVSHLPLTPKLTADRLELIGHLARANPHAKILSREKSVKCIFHGPHAYITPRWYREDDVPTWNYSVVHVEGKLEPIEGANEILECLRELSAHAERHWPSGWKFFVPDDLQEPMLSKHIVGFRIVAEKIQHKNKMGQNRSAEDLAGVVEGLSKRNDDGSRGVRQALIELFPELGK